jgi:dual specificity tyrosine-phosphorylation-regulated kinase 2/3/4
MINFTQSFYFRGHLCISTELLGMNLYEFIKAHEFKGFSLRLIRRFCKQMLASLTLLKTQRVIHCDLKPENILLAHPLHSEIKVIDFGSSCFENEKVYTYIQSRFYRSPEVILGMSYGLPIDMWSLGCILAELLTGYPIFPGENEQEQLACIMEIFGPPEKHLIEKSSRKKLFFDSLGKPRVTVSTKGRRRRPSSKTLQQALKCDDEAFLDFITRCLRWDPERRMKPDEAMNHEFITGARRTVRQRIPVNGTAASPVKRAPPTQTPQARVRPLPEPPATSIKNSSAANPSRERVPSSSSSPVKGAPPRRHSTVTGPPGPGGTAVKRAANGAPLNATSGLPRAAQRSVSGKPDLASAAAVASLVSRGEKQRDEGTCTNVRAAENALSRYELGLDATRINYESISRGLYTYLITVLRGMWVGGASRRGCCVSQVGCIHLRSHVYTPKSVSFSHVGWVVFNTVWRILDTRDGCA